MAERVERHLSASARPVQAEETKAVLRQGLTLLRDLGLETADDPRPAGEPHDNQR